MGSLSLDRMIFKLGDKVRATEAWKKAVGQAAEQWSMEGLVVEANIPYGGGVLVEVRYENGVLATWFSKYLELTVWNGLYADSYRVGNWVE